MDTFLDAVNFLAHLYYEAAQNNIDKKDQKEEYFDEFDFLDEYDEIDEEYTDEYSSDEIDEEYLSEVYEYNSYDKAIFNEMCFKILELSKVNYKLFENIVSLLTLEYYNIVLENRRSSKKINEDEIEDLIDIIEESTKKNYINKIINEDDDSLFEIISTISDEYGFEDEYEVACYVYPYEYIEDTLKDKTSREVYVKFHPNLKREVEELENYIEDIKIEEKLRKIKIDSLFGFIYFTIVLRNSFEDDFTIISALIEKIADIKDENPNLLNQIILYMTKYYYLTTKEKQKVEKLRDIDEIVLKYIETTPSEELINTPYADVLVYNFISYDILKCDKLEKTKSEEIAKVLKKF